MLPVACMWKSLQEVSESSSAGLLGLINGPLIASFLVAGMDSQKESW